MSAIIGRHVKDKDSDMTEGSKMCLECADALRRRNSSQGRRARRSGPGTRDL